jgi:Putative esterase
MTLHKVEGLPGAPWDRPLAGMLDRITVHSEVLEENPLGDPARRPLYVYRSPGAIAPGRERFPIVYVLQGYSGQLDMWLGRSAFEPTNVERLDDMFAARECPDAIVVFVDAWTSLGGSQFLNSSSTGRYLDYLCDEVIPFVDERYPTMPGREHRGVAGKSSGGYGAMVVPMLRPDVFGALASHAGDALFEYCYLPAFPAIARRLRDDFGGSFDELLRTMRDAPSFDWGRFGDAFSLYAYACAYTPDPDHRMPRPCGACGGSTSTPGVRTSSSWIWGHRRSPMSSRAWTLPTRSSCSTVSTEASPTGTLARSGSWCCRFASRDRYRPHRSRLRRRRSTRGDGPRGGDEPA